MTRIDVHPPKMLCDQHLLSNHREIKRICNRLRQRIKSNNFKDIPCAFYEKENDRFKELFWLDKGMWTKARFKELHNECIRRGFNVTDFSDNWDVYKDKPSMYNDFIPTKEHFDLLEGRILNRVQGMKSIRYYGREISFEDYYKNIWNNQKIILPLH